MTSYMIHVQTETGVIASIGASKANLITWASSAMAWVLFDDIGIAQHHNAAWDSQQAYLRKRPPYGELWYELDQSPQTSHMIRGR